MKTAPVPAQHTTTRLQGRWLTIVRLGGIILIALTLIAMCGRGEMPDAETVELFTAIQDTSGEWQRYGPTR